MGRPPGGRVAWVVAGLLLSAVAAFAQDVRAPLSVTVNGVDKGDAVVVLRGADVLVGVRSLEEFGLHGFSGTRDTIAGVVFVSLASLAPDVIYEFDERALALRLTVRPDLLERIERTLTSLRPPDIEFRRDNSAFVNYSVTLHQHSGYELFTDLGLSTRAGLVGTTLSYTAHQQPIRGLTSATFDQTGHLLRIVGGDAFANGGLLGGGLLLGGFTISREYSIDPYFVRYPTFNLSGAVTTPSIAEVYVNDRLVGTEQLGPGRFALAQLPITNGRNDARVVIRDAFGGVRDLSASYYLTTSVLARGLQEYQYSAGVERKNFGIENWSYGRPAFIGRHRVGLTNNLTIGGRFEARRELASGGPSLTARTPVGQFEAAAAISRATGAEGRAYSAAYSYSGQTFGAGVAAQAMTEQYATSSLDLAQDKPKRDISAFVSLRIGARTSLTLQRHEATLYLAGSSVRTALIGSARLTGRIDAFVTAALDRDATTGSRRDVFAGMSVRVTSRSIASISADRVDNGTPHLVTELQQSLPVGSGWGYRFHSEGGDRTFSSGALQYQGQYGRYEVRRDLIGGLVETTLSAAGGLVAMNGGVYASRPIQDGFALVRVPNVAGVRAYASNQEVGRTNGRGNLLVPNLLPYYGNVLNISDQDVPLDNMVSAVRKIVAPPYRGGALVIFPVQRVQGATGVIELETDGRRIAPSYGQLIVKATTGNVESPVGERGEFYLENVPAGRHDAVLQYRLIACTFSLDMPVSKAPIVDLGTIRCLAEAR